jgi:hypothetical protein
MLHFDWRRASALPPFHFQPKGAAPVTSNQNLDSRNPRTGRPARSASPGVLDAICRHARASLAVIPGENLADYQALFDRYLEAASPRSLRDLADVRTLAACEWRLRRLAAIETEMLSIVLRESAPAASPARTSPAELISRVFLAGRTTPFLQLARYAGSLERQYNSALRRLLPSRSGPHIPDSPARRPWTTSLEIPTPPPPSSGTPRGELAGSSPPASIQPRSCQTNPFPKPDSTLPAWKQPSAARPFPGLETAPDPADPHTPADREPDWLV